MKARIARLLPRLHATKERLKGALDAQHHSLQPLAVDFSMLRHSFLDTGKLGLLVIVVERDTPHAVGFASLPKGGIVDMTAEHKGSLKHLRLLGSGLELALAAPAYHHCLLVHALATLVILRVTFHRFQHDAASRRLAVRIGLQ